MSGQRTCRHCVHWNSVLREEVRGNGGVSMVSECRRHAPRAAVTSIHMGILRADWPRTSYSDWCGEFEPSQLPVNRDPDTGPLGSDC